MTQRVRDEEAVAADVDPATEAADGTRGDAEAGEAGPRAARPAGWWLVVTSVLLVVIVVAATLGTVTGLRARAASASEADRDQVVAVARQVVDDFISINGQNVQEHVDRMSAVATDPFRTELGKFSAVFGAILTQGQVQATGGIDAVGIERIDGSSATVLVSASTTVRNTEVPDGAPRDFRLVLGLRQEDGAWRVASVEVAP